MPDAAELLIVSNPDSEIAAGVSVAPPDRRGIGVPDRRAPNFSEYDPNHRRSGQKVAPEVQEGSMPPSHYTWFWQRGEAKLSQADRDALIKEVRHVFGDRLLAVNAFAISAIKWALYGASSRLHRDVQGGYSVSKPTSRTH